MRRCCAWRPGAKLSSGRYRHRCESGDRRIAVTGNDPTWWSVAAAAQAIRERTISPVELVDAALGAIHRLNHALNAFCTIDEETVLADARKAQAKIGAEADLGPLHGVPIAIKDLIFTSGLRTTGGS